jgi:MoxR-like ATPase
MGSAVRAVRADTEAAADASATSPQLLQAIAEITATVDARVAAAMEASAAQAAQAAAEAEAGGASAASDDSSPASPSAAAALLRARVEASVLKLQKGLLERDTEVRLMLLAALCGEHLLLLGPPGTAKSELSRRLSGLLGGQQGGDGTASSSSSSCAYFERLLTRFSVPEELFGPLSMRGLENDQYVRQTTGYLPTAEVAFVDGASKSILVVERRRAAARAKKIKTLTPKKNPNNPPPKNTPT